MLNLFCPKTNLFKSTCLLQVNFWRTSCSTFQLCCHFLSETRYFKYSPDALYKYKSVQNSPLSLRHILLALLLTIHQMFGTCFEHTSIMPYAQYRHCESLIENWQHSCTGRTTSSLEVDL